MAEAERNNYKTQYRDFAAKFVANFEHVQTKRKWVGHSVAAAFTARCLNGFGPEGGAPWPNVTLPDFADQVRGAVVLAQGRSIEFSPLFKNDNATRRAWEAYAVENEVSEGCDMRCASPHGSVCSRAPPAIPRAKQAVAMRVPDWAKALHRGDHGDDGEFSNG